MKWFICFLIIFSLGPICVLSEVQLVQSGSEVVKPGETLSLTCRASFADDGKSIDTYGWHWIRQPPGKGLEWMGRIRPLMDNTGYAPAFQSRISISATSSANEIHLQLRSMTGVDTATYYCAGGVVAFYYWGQGTFVTVASVTQSGPSLFPLILPSEKALCNGLITVGCLAKDVPPALVRFTWGDHKNAIVDASHVTQYPTIGKSDRTFTASSLLTVSVDDWENLEPFYCKAEGVVGAARVVRQASPQEPKMIIRAPRLEDFENATIFCKAAHLQTPRTTIQWLKDGDLLDSGFTTTGPVATKCSGYSIHSELIVDKSDWDANKKFSCRVQNNEFSDIENISKALVCDCSDPGAPDIHVETIPPSFADIYMTQSVKLTCRISNIPYGETVTKQNVIWMRASDNKELETVIGETKEQANSGLFFVDATATICKEEWESQDTFQCKVSLPKLLPTTETRTLSKLRGGTLYAPAVYVLSPPPEQLASRETATVTCLMKGFYPKDSFMQWLKNGVPVGDSEYFTSQPIQESKSPERYFAYSMLNANEQEWSSGATYTCMVGHEALPLQTTQKTIDKHTGKPTQVNVSLVLTDSSNTCY